MRWRLGLFFCLLAVAGSVWAAGSPVTFHDCRTMSYPVLVVVDHVTGDTTAYQPGVYADTLTIEVDSIVTVYAWMGVDDSTGSADAYHCNDDSIHAQWRSPSCEEDSFYQFEVILYTDQPEPPDWVRYEFTTWTSEIDTLSSGTCPGAKFHSPYRFLMGDVAFTRSGVGALTLRGRILDLNEDYLSPGGDSCKVYYRVGHTPSHQGSGVMVTPAMVGP